MNVQQLRALLEIRRTGSVTKAASLLGMSQPNLSRSVKEVEHELGVTLFRRGPQGMEPTAEAAQVLLYAQSIVGQMDELESIYSGRPDSLHFGIAAPHAAYITRGLAEFLNHQRCTLDVRYLEVQAQAALEALVRGEVQLAVVRYQSIYEEYYKEIFAQSSLAWRVLMQYKAVVVMGQNHPLASEEFITPQQLADYPQLVEGDIQLPVDLGGKVLKEERITGHNRVHVQDRASQMLLLRELKGSYMWSPGLSPAELAHRHLIQRSCNGGDNKDIVLWRARPGLGPTARDCLVALQSSARKQALYL